MPATKYEIVLNGEAISDNIKRLRKESGLTQSKLAEKLGVSKAIISAYEKGSRRPSLDIMMKMTQIFHVSIAQFITPYDFVPEYKPSDQIDVSKLTPQQKMIIREMIRGFEKENELLKEEG